MMKIYGYSKNKNSSYRIVIKSRHTTHASSTYQTTSCTGNTTGKKNCHSRNHITWTHRSNFIF